MPINKKSQLRINCLLRLMKENRYPNYPMLVKEMKKLDIAGTYEISQKTIQRDVAYLKSEFNAPIRFCPVNKGYYLTNLNWTEMPVVAEAEMNAAILGARLAETIFPPSKIGTDIRTSVDTLLTENWSDMDESMVLCSLVATGSRAKINPEIFQTVFESWQSHHSMRICYRRVGDGRVLNMLVEPHVLVLHDNVWYIKAKLLQSGNYIHKEEPFLTLAVHRIEGALKQLGRFEPDYEMIKKVNAGNLFELPKIPEVKLRLSGSAIGYGTEYLPGEAMKKQPDGSVNLVLHDIEEYRVLNFVLASGGDALIIAPADLAEKAVACAEKFITAQKNTP